MSQSYNKQIHSAIDALLATGDEAITYFTRRDLLGETAEPVHPVQEMSEPRQLLRKQSTEGWWQGPAKKTPVYPPDHPQLVATFKSFRLLVERYQFNREFAPVAKAAEYLFSFQTDEGDIRGFIGNQYATYYTGYVLSLLIRAGYIDDPRIERGIRWLLDMRQEDGGWSIPILTRYFDGQTMYRLTSSRTEPVEPDRSQPFSHNWTDMVLRVFAVHPVYRRSEEAHRAGKLLKSCFFKPDAYSLYKAASYWTRFAFWWPNLLTALETLFLLGFPADDPDISNGLQWFLDNQREDSLWDCAYNGKHITPNKTIAIERAWVSLRICRVLQRFLG